MPELINALVTRNTGSNYTVVSDEGKLYDCKIKGNFRLKGIRTTNPVAVGDRVEIQPSDDGTASYITKITPRRNYIIRRASNLSKESHIIASNLDLTILVVTLREPVTPLTFIDRFLATAEAYRIPAAIVINKIDILEDKEDKELLEGVSYLYRSIGYPVIETSAKDASGIEEIKKFLDNKTTLFSGNSGVGKSSLINAVIPGVDLKTADISSTHHTGMHTTTFSQMVALPPPMTGYIIDTPGVKGFGTVDFSINETGHYFPEIFKMSENCRFNNCTHTHEPGCAVRAAVEDSLIAQSRYSSYLSILEDASPDKYRKPF